MSTKFNLSERHLCIHQPANTAEISETEKRLGVVFPEEYKLLLVETNGLNRNADGLVLYSTDEIAERNYTFEVKKYLPDFLLIGDNSGGYGLLISLNAPHAIYLSGFGDFSKEGLQTLGASISDWVKNDMYLPD